MGKGCRTYVYALALLRDEREGTHRADALLVHLEAQ